MKNEIISFGAYNFQKASGNIRYVSQITGKMAYVLLDGKVYQSVIYNSLLGSGIYDIMGETYGANRLLLYEDHGNYLVKILF